MLEKMKWKLKNYKEILKKKKDPLEVELKQIELEEKKNLW